MKQDGTSYDKTTKPQTNWGGRPKDLMEYEPVSKVLYVKILGVTIKILKSDKPFVCIWIKLNTCVSMWLLNLHDLVKDYRIY